MLDTKDLDHVIFETNEHPFGVNAYNKNEKVFDFVGRKKELHEFREFIQTLTQQRISQAIRLEGAAGVGKSTLFNYVKESIEREKKDEVSSSFYLDANIDVFSTYFQLPGKVNSFTDLWKPMLEHLAAEFTEEMDMDVSYPEYVVYKFIFRCFELYPKEIAEIIWKDRLPPRELKYIVFNDILDPVYDYAEQVSRDFKNFYQNNKRKLRRELRTEIDGRVFEIKKIDTDILTKLFGTLDENDEFLSQIINGDPKEFKDDDALISFFNALNRFYTVAAKKVPVVLIGIDEIAKVSVSTKEEETNYFKNLGNLLVRLRNNLNLILFVLISTTEDWEMFDATIEREGDLKSQLQAFIKKMVLKQMEIEETIQVFKNRIIRFWQKYPMNKSDSHLYYPFTENFFDYVYRYNSRDLRSSIIHLHKIWSTFRYMRSFTYTSNMFEIMRFVRQQDNNLLDGQNVKKFEWKIIEDYFNNSVYSKSNSARSSAIERGLEGAWKVLRQDSNLQINSVQNNPTIHVSNGGTRRPDILIEVAGELGMDHLRRVEFQVKAYRNKKVSKTDIESSIQLFEEGYTDIIYFIITGEGFDSQAQFVVDKLREEYPNRILNPILGPNQELYLIFLALYKEIYGWPLGNSIDNDMLTVENVLQVLLGRNPRTFLSMVKQLSSRGFKPIPVTESVLDKKGSSSIDDIFSRDDQTELAKAGLEMVEESGIIDEEDQKTEDLSTAAATSNWLVSYEFMKNAKNEACALARYLESRENNARFKNKFTIATVDKNMIKPNAQLDTRSFKVLVEEMEEKGLLTKQKTTFELTDDGISWYEAVKKANFTV
jgi:Cdc6-like AAA superfamily ATPase